MINRPVIKDYWDENNNFKWGVYTEKLENYCDSLEEMLRFYKRALNARYGLSATPEESGMRLIKDE